VPQDAGAWKIPSPRFDSEATSSLPAAIEAEAANEKPRARPMTGNQLILDINIFSEDLPEYYAELSGNLATSVQGNQ
jgi:hypothetical protein